MNQLINALSTLSYTDLFLLHSVISIVVTTISTYFLKKHYEDSNERIFFIILIFNLCLPIIGYFFAITFSIILSYTRDKTYLHNSKEFNKGEFNKNNFPTVKRIFGESAVISLSTDKNNLSKNKMKGLVFMAENPTKQNFSLIKQLLSDKDNEIRLYSFSLINSTERELTEKISQIQNSLNKSSNEVEHSRLATQLAYLYWEFIYLGLIDKETNSLVVDKINNYSKIALMDEDNKGKIFTLLGKVSFHQKKFKKASTFFQKAIKEGIKKSKVAPYLAEIAYEKKSFSDVKAILSEMNPMENSSFTAPIYKQWTGK